MNKLILAAALSAAVVTTAFAADHIRVTGTVKIEDELITQVVYNQRDFADMNACKEFLAEPDEEFKMARELLIKAIGHNHHVEPGMVSVTFGCEASDR